MNQNSYVKSIERINQVGVKHAVTDEMLALMREVFTEDQAALIGDFPPGVNTVNELSKALGRDEKILDKMLKEMAENGLILVTKRENGDKEYSVLPFEPGLIELLFLKGKDDEKTRKFAKLMQNVSNVEKVLLEGVLSQPELARQVFPSPSGARIVAIEEIISNDKKIVPWEKVSDLIEGENSYAVGECSCKHVGKLSGTPCKSEAPSKCCIWFGKVADYMVEREYATRLSQEELYALLKKCEDAGLVHFTANSPHPAVLCNCCKCCCGYLKLNNLVRQTGITFMESSNFVARLNEETCNGCGECVEYCQLEALQLSGDSININPDYCRGCGVCVSKCPTESLSLVRVSNHRGLII
jgi:Pyruvate/2-oxoacid:ferredoxin oxidoreductase delta subunit